MASTDPPARRARRGPAVRLLAVAVAVAAPVVGSVAPAGPAAAYPAATVSLAGHGDGPGDGMGQWGALGYALDDTPYATILAHFYGGTAPETLSSTTAPPETHTVSVVMTELNGLATVVTSSTAFHVGSVSVPAGGSVKLTPTGSGTSWSWTVAKGTGCSGAFTTVATGVSDPVVVPADLATQSLPPVAADDLELCEGAGTLNVEGEIEGEFNSDFASRILDLLPLEEYVAGVVPNESEAGWGGLGTAGPQGEPWGFQELEAQAVAARTYVMAGIGTYGGYADICDLLCQSYRGITNQDALSDAAVTDTRGQVLVAAHSSTLVSTQYSASTGGYTAGGAFPAVPDTGDAVCTAQACNPDHDWTVDVPVATVESTWPALGTLQSIEILTRNGDGDFGGRVETLALVGSSSTVDLTGDEFQADLGLLSDWFTVTNALTAPAVGMATTADGAGYWLGGADGSVLAFGDAAFDGDAAADAPTHPLVGIAATPDGRGYWQVATDGGIFTFGDARFYGSTGALTLNQPIVGMAPTPDGRGYWLVAADGGIFAFGDAAFHGSTGNLTLNRPIVGMAATADGRGYWLVASDGGIFAFGDAVFHGSMGGVPLNRPVVGMSVAPGGAGYRLVAADGGIFSFGAPFYGSTGNLDLVAPIVGMADTPDGRGYWMVAADGGIFSFGDAHFYGSGG